MKILVAIPHFYKPTGGGFYGSRRPDPKPRSEALAQCLAALHQHFGPRQGLLDVPARCLSETNGATGNAIDIVVCTTGEAHLLSEIPPGNFRRHVTRARPPLLGYEAHAVLRDGLGNYDWYCYLEDDTLITDPLFFDKLAWFQQLAGEGAVLQPNRYEVSATGTVRKLYIDCNLIEPKLSEPFQDVRNRPRITGQALGKDIVFQRVNNPHAGCFFLSEPQMRHWSRQSHFLDRSTAFAGPLESAATLGVMRTFHLYKPARENASFLEVGHIHVRYLGRYVAFEKERAPWRFRILKPESDA